MRKMARARVTHAKPSRARRRETARKGSRAVAIPRGYHTITPHLTVRGAADAIDFYKRAFGARERGRMPLPDLLAELIKDAAQRKTFFTVAGMKPPDDEKAQKEK